MIRQVRDAEPDLEPTRHPSISGTAHSSPMFGPSVLDALEDIPEDDIMADTSTPSAENQLSSSFKQQAMRNSKGKDFWDTFEGETHRTPPPHPLLPRGSSSGMSDDISMMTPPSMFQMPSVERAETASSSGRSSTPQPGLPPSAAEITRKVNNKRRRDDDFDPSSFKRRAVSPGISVHNSPVIQSPMQRDVNPWGAKLTSGGGDKVVGGSGKDGIVVLDRADEAKRIVVGNGVKRVGFQGMENANDGLMNMSIE